MFRVPPPPAAAAAQQQQPSAGSDSAVPYTPTSDDGPSPSSSSTASSPGSSDSLSFVQGLMDQNPYFSAGAGLMGITAFLAVGRRLVTVSTTLAQRRLLVSLEIPSKDHSYPWFLEWMARNSAQHPTDTSVGGMWKRLGKMKGLKSHELAVETSYKKHENGSSEALFSLVPGPGTHWFRYRGAWMQVKRDRSQKQMDLHSGSPWETLTLTTLSRDRDLFPLLLSEARQLAQESEEGKTVVYTAWGVEWRPFGKPRRVREMKSVVLSEGVGEEIERDLKTFMGRGKWYADRGIPYRRGYLLHGPPGSGKSSYIQALAGSLSYNICLLNLSERGLTDDKLSHLLSLVPERSIVLLEDVDAAFSKRVQTSEDGYQSSVTFSGLLNTLDGVASAEERIIFMTTNHLSKLDPALVRPGRVDLVSYLGDATAYQAKELFTRFYGGGEDDVEAEALRRRAEFVESYVDERWNGRRAVSMAALQGLFIRCEAKDVKRELPVLFAERGVDVDPRSLTT